MAKDCTGNTILGDTSAISSDLGVKNQVDSLLNGFMGTENEVAVALSGKEGEKPIMEAWRKARAGLTRLLMENYQIIRIENYKPEDYIVTLKDFLQGQFKLPGGKHLFVKGNPRRTLAASKLINQLVNLHDTRYGKKLNPFERAFFPIMFFARRIDRFGFISKYINSATQLIENSKQAGSIHKDRLNTAHSKYLQSVNAMLQYVMNTTGYVGKEYVMDGVTLRDSEGRYVRFLGSQEDENGNITHNILNEETGEKETLSANDISNNSIVAALAGKYTFRFANDVMAGQARNITWKNDVNPVHKKEISWLLRKLHFKILQGDDKDLSQGIDGIYEVTYKGTKFQYAILKDAAHKEVDEKGAVVDEVLTSSSESYSAYLVRHVDKSGTAVNYFEKNKEGDFELQNKYDVESESKRRGSPFRNGWYKAKEQKVFGRRVRVDGEGTMRVDKTDNEKGFNFDGINNLYLANQPHADMLTGRIEEQESIVPTPDVEYTTFWPMITELRSAYNTIGKEMYREGQLEVEKLDDWVKNRLPKMADKLESILPRAELEEFFTNMNSMFGLGKRFYLDNNGNVVTPNSRFQMIRSNYVPFLYEDPDLMNMLEDEIAAIELKLSRLPEGDEEVKKRLLEKLDHLELAYAKLTENEEAITTLSEKLDLNRGDVITRQVVAERTAYTKHREEWTDITRRKKDSEVTDKYVDNIYYSFTKNRLMASMLETLSNILDSDISDMQKRDLVLWLGNRTQVALGDPTAKAGIGKFEYGYEQIAKLMNKYIPGQRTWTAKEVQRLIQYTKGTLTAMLLGHSGAMLNRTQIINPFIGAGWDMVKKADTILADKDNSFSRSKAMAIISRTGIDQITNMFEVVMSHGGDLTLADAGLISTPFFSLPIPTQTWKDFMIMVKNNRQKYIRDGIPEIDAMLLKTELDRVGAIRETGQRIAEKEKVVLESLEGISKKKAQYQLNLMQREYNRLTSPGDRRSVRELRENFLDLITMPKTPDNAKERAKLEKKFKKILGDVTETRMQRMIAWKLSFWWDSFAPELFTFTEGERHMRRQTALIALLNAAEIGALGGSERTTDVTYKDPKTGEVHTEAIPDIFLTPEAIRIARNAVSNDMFGMSTLHMGDALGGLGQQLFLYKTYPINQMIHDYNVVKTFMAGNLTKKQAVKRIEDAFMYYLRGYYRKTVNGTKFEYNPKDNNLDHEALAVVRFFSTRVAMSVFSIMAEVLNLFKFMIRTPIAKIFGTMLRGGENPALGVILRLGTNLLILSMFDEDDDDAPSAAGVTWDILRLFFPVFLTLPIQLITNWTD